MVSLFNIPKTIEPDKIRKAQQGRRNGKRVAFWIKGGWKKDSPKARKVLKLEADGYEVWRFSNYPEAVHGQFNNNYFAVPSYFEKHGLVGVCEYEPAAGGGVRPVMRGKKMALPDFDLVISEYEND